MATKKPAAKARATAQSEARTKPAPRTSPAHLARAPAPLARRDDDESLWADGLVDTVNQHLRRAEVEHDVVADLLVRELFGNDVEAALAPDRHATPRYAIIRERAGSSLHLDAPSLSAHLRIGAVNQLRRDDAWHGLSWSKREELLPLLALDDRRRRFNAGVMFAGGPNVGVRHVREWVQRALPRNEKSVGRPRALTVPAGTRLARTGLQLADAAQRQAFAARLARVPAPQRKAFVKDLRDTHKHIGALLRELDEQR